MPFMYNHGLHDLDPDSVPLNLTLRDELMLHLFCEKKKERSKRRTEFAHKMHT